MLNITPRLRWLPVVAVACAVVAGCAPKTDVSATGSVPSQYSHFYLTTQEVWFNTSATAGPDDTTWAKFPLTTPVTVDLATTTAGTLASVTTGLALPVGNYLQVRLIPVDAGVALTSAAQGLGALYNSEVDYVDGSGTLHQAPLELQNADKGIGVVTALAIKGQVDDSLTSGTTTGTTTGTDATSTASASSATGLLTDTGTTTTGTTSTDTTGTTTTGTTVTTTGTTATTGTTLTPVTVAINLDGVRDLVPFTYGTVSGVLLSPTATAYDSTTAGAITGTVILSGLSTVTSGASSAFVNIQVTAESLSTDGTRHSAVNSTSVRSDGTFTLYPLPTGSATHSAYDLVIHGPTIAAVVIKSVPVLAGDPASTTPTSIGTVTPRAATSFAANVSTATPVPAGAHVGFYQTLTGSGEVPYLIEERPVDPFNRNFAANLPVSAQTIDQGTYASSGSTIALSTVTPKEGSRSYRAAATAPLFADGALTAIFKGPELAATTTLVAIPALTVEPGNTSNTVTFTVSQTSPGRFNKGELILSHDGAVVATAPLDAVLARSGSSLALAGIPGGISATVLTAGLYYVSVRVWNTSNPATTLSREVYPAALDLRNRTVAAYSLNID